jgi:hypothetical protein
MTPRCGEKLQGAALSRSAFGGAKRKLAKARPRRFQSGRFGGAPRRRFKVNAVTPAERIGKGSLERGERRGRGAQLVQAHDAPGQAFGQCSALVSAERE